MSKRTEFWLWWFADDCGKRRRTPFRMSREEALKRYPDAEPIAGTLEIMTQKEVAPSAAQSKPISERSYEGCEHGKSSDA